MNALPRHYNEIAALLLALPAIGLPARAASANPIFGSNDPAVDKGSPDTAHADRTIWRPGFGARVGGYGFRNPSTSKWDECRMNGVGVFGTLDANKYLFGELSFDFYGSTPDLAAEGLDRESTHGLVAAGLRMFPDFVLTPYVQIGGGGEWTHVRATDGSAERAGVYPMGFIGVGAELNITRELKLGANVRVLATMRPEYVEASSNAAALSTTSQALSGDAKSTPPTLELGFASQAQFFLRYTL